MSDQFIISKKMFKAMSRYIEQGPFHKVLGIQVISLDLEDVRIKIEMKEHLIGNGMQQSLQGGVIASVLDLVGGVTASIGMAQSLKDRSPKILAERYAKVGTIDLRVDYLKPGRGPYFIANGKLIHIGNSVAFVRMEMHNAEKQLIAVGSAAFKIG